MKKNTMRVGLDIWQHFQVGDLSGSKTDDGSVLVVVILTRNGVNKDIIVRFEHLLNEYFEGDAPQNQGLPSVKYFADKVFLSANYFSDMVRKQTGKTVSEYIQDKMIGLVKEQLLSTDKTTSQIAYEIGFQYPQHLSRMFKRVVGMTPNKFRLQS